MLPDAGGDEAPEGGAPEEDELEDDELLLEELLEELEELLDELEELLDDGAELGVEGGWGTVGLLALGHPLSATTAAPTSASLVSMPMRPLPLPACCVICPTQFIGIHRFTGLESWPEAGLAQLPHKAIGPGFVLQAVVDSAHIDHPAARADPEFYQ